MTNTSKSKLIKSYSLIGQNDLQDFYMAIAQSIEASLIQAGAKPGDYTLLDLYQLAQPFVLERWKDVKNPLEFSLSW